MTTEVTLFYRRDPNAETSTGRIESRELGASSREEVTFEAIAFREMLKLLCTVLSTGQWPADTLSIMFQRTDRTGLIAYRLDPRTVHLFCTDPVAAIASMTAMNSPSTTEKRVREERRPPAPPLLRAGYATMADAFGDVLYFRTRENMLECPGCGFWSAFTSMGLLTDPDRAGQEFKTMFACRGKCLSKLPVSCLDPFLSHGQQTWGYIRTEYLLENTQLSRFYFPRQWNGHRPWVSREVLRTLWDEYKNEKETLR